LGSEDKQAEDVEKRDGGCGGVLWAQSFRFFSLWNGVVGSVTWRFGETLGSAAKCSVGEESRNANKRAGVVSRQHPIGWSAFWLLLGLHPKDRTIT
jgi:hypothetical protein